MVGQYQESSRPMNQFNEVQRLAVVILVFTTSIPTMVTAQTSRPIEGFTEPHKTVVVASPESGVLDSVVVEEGDVLTKGAIITTLDSQVLNASLNIAREKLNAKGKINAAKATLKSRANHFSQMQQLFYEEHASDKEVKQAELEFELAKANVEAAGDQLRALEMELKQIEAQLERRVIRAPIAGTVLELPRQIGEAVTATESQVATIVALDYLRVRFFLATQRATSLRAGQVIGINFPATNQQTDAIVDFVSPVTDSKSGTVRVELLIDNQNRQFRSGVRCLLGSVRTAKTDSRLKLTTDH